MAQFKDPTVRVMMEAVDTYKYGVSVEEILQLAGKIANLPPMVPSDKVAALRQSAIALLIRAGRDELINPDCYICTKKRKCGYRGRLQELDGPCQYFLPGMG